MGEAKQIDFKTKALAGALILLGALLFLETGYLVKAKMKEDAEREVRRRSAYPRQPLAPRRPSLLDEYFGTRDWDPFEEMERMQEQVNRMFRESLRRALPMTGSAPLAQPMVFEPDIDIQEKKDHYLIQVDIPGMEKDQIKVDVTENTLAISGERRASEEIQKEGFYKSERSFGSFMRQVPLPADAVSEQVTAQYDKGVLTVKIPKVTPGTSEPSRRESVPVQ